jgi:hypothetical protein
VTQGIGQPFLAIAVIVALVLPFGLAVAGLFGDVVKLAGNVDSDCAGHGVKVKGAAPKWDGAFCINGLNVLYPVIRARASRYFSEVLRTISSGRGGGGACLFQSRVSR